MGWSFSPQVRVCRPARDPRIQNSASRTKDCKQDAQASQDLGAGPASGALVLGMEFNGGAKVSAMEVDDTYF